MTVSVLAIAGTAFAGEFQFSPGDIIYPAPSDSVGKNFEGVPLGRSHLKLNGWLVETMLPRDPTVGRSFGEKLSGLPVINLMIHKSPPAPSDKGGYFLWKSDSHRPWVSVAAHTGDRGPFSTFSGEGPTPGMVSLSF